jgi:hypothetical protein
MTEEEKCGATRDHLLGTGLEGKFVSVCEKPKGHDLRGEHRALMINHEGKPSGTIHWRGDDREPEA